MTRIKGALLLTFALMVIANLKAQTDSTYKFTLTEAQDYAIQHYYMSKNAELDMQIAKKKIWETTAIGLPQISAGVDYTHMPQIPEMNFPITEMAGNKGDNEPIVGGDFRDENFYQMVPGEAIKLGVPNQFTYNITLSQIIFSGEYIVGLQASKVYSTFAKENYEKIMIDLKESISSNYYAIKIVNKNREVISKTLENLNLSLSHTQKFYEQGLVEDTDVDQLKLVVKRTENTLNMIERQKTYLTKMLKYQLGFEVDVKIELTQDVDELIEKNIIQDDQYIFDLNNNITHKILTTQENLQELSMKREKSTFLPTISGFYKYNDQFEKPDFDMNIKHVLGVSMQIPIASSGMRLSKVSQAKMEYYKAQNMRQQEAQRLILAAEQAKYDYDIALQRYKNEQENFELSERIFNKTNVRFKEGVVSALDLSTINNQFLEAQLSLSTATQELLMAKIAIDKAFNKL